MGLIVFREEDADYDRLYKSLIAGVVTRYTSQENTIIAPNNDNTRR